jgi:hypothetical protein
MSVIENFSALSEKELNDFAEALIKTINSEHIFTSDANFSVYSVEADELSGDLEIVIDHDDYINIDREASWTCRDDEYLDNAPEDISYSNLDTKDAAKAFKTLSAEIEGYTVTLDIDDVEVEEIVAFDVDHYTEEDSGIGDYEYAGHRGYDSHPYLVVSGTVTAACNCALALYVSVAEPTVE